MALTLFHVERQKIVCEITLTRRGDMNIVGAAKMPFVKLDCGMLNSTTWFDREAREVFITALLMAEPWQTDTACPQLEVQSLDETGWRVPPGRYGFIAAAGVGILARAGVLDIPAGLSALERLGAPESSSRSQDFDGRRLVRVDGGYVALNYDKFRERDYTTAARSRRYRERKAASSHRDATPPRRDITEAEAEAEDQNAPEVSKPSIEASSVPVDRFAEFWTSYPRKVGKIVAKREWDKIKPSAALVAAIVTAVQQQRASVQWAKDGGEYIPHPRTWLAQGRWMDEPINVPQVSERTARTIASAEAFVRAAENEDA